MENIILSITHSTEDGKSRRVTKLTGASEIEIFYEFDRIVPFSEETVLDGHVLAVLLYAMSKGNPLMVRGPLSRQFLRNIEELQLAWNRWKPDRYKKIEIIPDRIISDFKARSEGAIAAFSGGVDATFTALRNTHSESPARYPVKSALMVHGFDVNIGNDKDFACLVNRVRPFIDDLKLDLRIVRTNSKDLELQDWEDTFALQLAACLHMFSDEFGYGLIGSSEPYDELVIPWGSSPITDHLMSGDGFSVVHDGAGYSRTDKVAEIKNNSIACETLKVCWEGKEQGTNCGKCEKCTRTKLNFLAAGAPSMPPCLRGELEINDIKNIPIRNAAQLSELESIILYAAQRQVSAPWLNALKWRISRYSGLNKVKRIAKSVLKSMGLYEQAKRLYQQTQRIFDKI